MFTHVNVGKDKNIIRERFEEGLKILNDEMFFITVDFLGYYICSLFNTSFSASDCCNTVETLENIFQIPQTNKYIKMENSTELENIFNTQKNTFYNFKVMPKGLPFHTFVIIKYKNNWYMLQSFFGICGLHVNEDINIPKILFEYLDSPTISRFNQLFGTDLANPSYISSPNMKVSYHEFEKLPTEHLISLINKFLQK